MNNKKSWLLVISQETTDNLYITHQLEGRETKDEANGVQNVWLPWAVEPRDGIKVGVKGANVCAVPVGLEALEDYVLHVHPPVPPINPIPKVYPTIRYKAIDLIKIGHD